MESPKSALFDAGSESSPEKRLEALLVVDVTSSAQHVAVAIKIGQLEASLDDVERVGQKCTHPSRHGRGHEILPSAHFLLLEGPQPCEVDVATEGSLEGGCHESLVEAGDAIMGVDVAA